MRHLPPGRQAPAPNVLAAHECTRSSHVGDDIACPVATFVNPRPARHGLFKPGPASAATRTQHVAAGVRLTGPD